MKWRRMNGRRRRKAWRTTYLSLVNNFTDLGFFLASSIPTPLTPDRERQHADRAANKGRKESHSFVDRLIDRLQGRRQGKKRKIEFPFTKATEGDAFNRERLGAGTKTKARDLYPHSGFLIEVGHRADSRCLFFQRKPGRQLVWKERGS